jgi:hypothetical protein
MKTRINGIPYNLQQLTSYELDALLDMAAGRIATAQSDIEKLRQEQTRRNQRMLDILA